MWRSLPKFDIMAVSKRFRLPMVAFAIVFWWSVEPRQDRFHRSIACVADRLGCGLVRAPQDALGQAGT
jgi:hypothetical protein